MVKRPGRVPFCVSSSSSSSSRSGDCGAVNRRYKTWYSLCVCSSGSSISSGDCGAMNRW